MSSRIRWTQVEINAVAAAFVERRCAEPFDNFTVLIASAQEVLPAERRRVLSCVSVCPGDLVLVIRNLMNRLQQVPAATQVMVKPVEASVITPHAEVKVEYRDRVDVQYRDRSVAEVLEQQTAGALIGLGIDKLMKTSIEVFTVNGKTSTPAQLTELLAKVAPTVIASNQATVTAPKADVPAPAPVVAPEPVPEPVDATADSWPRVLIMGCPDAMQQYITNAFDGNPVHLHFVRPAGNMRLDPNRYTRAIYLAPHTPYIASENLRRTFLTKAVSAKDATDIMKFVNEVVDDSVVGVLDRAQA